MIECDVLVVGAGPAGSSAARAAAMRGAKTIFIDKKKEVGVPVQCAEGIGKYLFPYLPFKIPKSQLKWRIDGVLFNSGNITIERRGRFWEGYTIDRSSFDKYLSNLAINSGAKLMIKSELIEFKFDKDRNVKRAILKVNKRRTKEIKPKLIIGADGAESKVLDLIHKYKPKKGDVATVHSWEMKNLKLKNPHFEHIYMGDFSPSGYAYIFPKSKDSANVGIGHIYPEENDEENKKLEDFFYNFLEEESLKNQFKDATFVIEKSGKAVIGNIVDEWIHGNVLLVGEAANHNLKPFVEGILPSIISGNLAGEISTRMIKGENILMKNYLDSVEKLLNPHFRLSTKLIDILKRIYAMKTKEKHLLFCGIASGLFELERLDELESASYEVLEESLLMQQNR